MADKFNLEGFKVDENNACTAEGGFEGNITGSVTGDVTGAINQAPQLSESLGVVPNFAGVATLDANSAALTLALSDIDGRRMSILCLDGSITQVITADFGGGITTATFDTAGQTLDLISLGFWYVVGNNGVVLA